MSTLSALLRLSSAPRVAGSNPAGRCSTTVFNDPKIQARPPTSPAIVAAETGVFSLEKLDRSLFQRFRYTQPGVIHTAYNLFWNAEPGCLRNFKAGHFNVEAQPRFADPHWAHSRLMVSRTADL